MTRILRSQRENDTYRHQKEIENKCSFIRFQIDRIEHNKQNLPKNIDVFASVACHLFGFATPNGKSCQNTKRILFVSTPGNLKNDCIAVWKTEIRLLGPPGPN